MNSCVAGLIWAEVARLDGKKAVLLFGNSKNATGYEWRKSYPDARPPYSQHIACAYLIELTNEKKFEHKCAQNRDLPYYTIQECHLLIIKSPVKLRFGRSLSGIIATLNEYPGIKFKEIKDYWASDIPIGDLEKVCKLKDEILLH